MTQPDELKKDELLVWSSKGENGLTYPFCPYCFNYPPFEDFKAGTGRPRFLPAR